MSNSIMLDTRIREKFKVLQKNISA
jgi:hypothetical protein